MTATIDKKNNSINIKAEEEVPAAEKGQKPTVSPLKSSDLLVNLNDSLLNLDKEVTITVNGKVKFTGKVKRSLATMMRNLKQRGDINYAYPAQVTIPMQ